MVKGHVFANFLALYLMVALQKECEAKRIEFPWDDGIWDLREVRAVWLNLQGKRYLFRTELKGFAHDLFKAVGVRPPLSVQQLL